MKLLLIISAILTTTTLFTAAVASASVFNLNQLSHRIRPSSDESTQQRAALNVVRRLIPSDVADYVAIKINFNLPGNYFKLQKTNISRVLNIEASNGVSACKAFQYYLKNFCGAHISWDGNQIPIITDFPLVDMEARSSSDVVYYQNVCTHSYSFAWWTWNDWSRHIDWIALSGITLTLAPFQEDIWIELLTEYGLTRDEIEQHLAGVGFFAWQRMGNMRGWGGPLSRRFVDFASQLQQKMVKSLNELGIAVALPAFAGHLPLKFAELYPNVQFTHVESWNNFPSQFCCPLFVDPTESLFHELGSKFLSKFIAKYGTNHIYTSDPFNEVQPRLTDVGYLRNVSHSIYSAMATVDEGAIWLLQGWMFVKNPLWRDELIEAFLTAVPQGKLLMLDLQSEQHPQYERTHSFYGHHYIWCMLHNFGGTQGMHGSVRIVNREIPRAASLPNSTMIGVGITPEGIHQNYVVYELALDKAWHYKQINQRRWIMHYAQARYGFNSSEIEHAWRLLLKSVYAFKGQQNMRGKYTICRRPTLKWSPWTWYDYELVRKALGHFIAAVENEENENSLSSNQLFKRDLVDVTRQFLQNQADLLFLNITKAYMNQNVKRFSSYTSKFLELLTDLDSILATHGDFLLGRFIERAKTVAGDDEDELRQFEFNALNQITLWGPTGQILDYATKQWSGIVMDYYLPRWQLFFDQLKYSLEQRVAFNQGKFARDVFEQVELPFNLNRKVYPTEPKGNSLVVAAQLYHKWSNIAKIKS